MFLLLIYFLIFIGDLDLLFLELFIFKWCFARGASRYDFAHGPVWVDLFERSRPFFSVLCFAGPSDVSRRPPRRLFNINKKY